MTFCKGEAGGGPSPGRNVTWVAHSWHLVLFSHFLTFLFLSFFFGEGFGGKETEVPRLLPFDP